MFLTLIGFGSVKPRPCVVLLADRAQFWSIYPLQPWKAVKLAVCRVTSSGCLPRKSVLRLTDNSLNLSYVFIVYCRLISAWQFVAFLGSCKLNGSLKNSIPYVLLYLFEMGSAIMFVPECTTRYDQGSGRLRTP